MEAIDDTDKKYLFVSADVIQARMDKFLNCAVRKAKRLADCNSVFGALKIAVTLYALILIGKFFSVITIVWASKENITSRWAKKFLCL